MKLFPPTVTGLRAEPNAERTGSAHYTTLCISFLRYTDLSAFILGTHKHFEKVVFSCSEPSPKTKQYEPRSPSLLAAQNKGIPRAPATRLSPSGTFPRPGCDLAPRQRPRNAIVPPLSAEPGPRPPFCSLVQATTMAHQRVHQHTHLQVLAAWRLSIAVNCPHAQTKVVCTSSSLPWCHSQAALIWCPATGFQHQAGDGGAHTLLPI